MKNSSGAIGAAKAPPYLVSHRRIINVIRIMYPRNSDQQGCGERKEGGMGNCGGRDAYLCCGIYRGGTSRRKGKEKEMEKGGRDGACTKGTPTVPSRSFTPTGAYTLPPQSRSRDHCGAMPSPCILHSPLFARTPKREYGSTQLEYHSRFSARHECRKKSKNLKQLKLKKNKE